MPLIDIAPPRLIPCERADGHLRHHTCYRVERSSNRSHAAAKPPHSTWQHDVRPADRVGGSLHFHPVVAIQLDGISRTHGVGALFEPQKLLLPVSRESRQQKQDYRILFDFRANFRYAPEIFSPGAVENRPGSRRPDSCPVQNAAQGYA